MAGVPPQVRDRRLPAGRLRPARRDPAARQPVGRGERRRLAVRRPLRAGRSPADRAGHDAVPGQRPARPATDRTATCCSRLEAEHPDTLQFALRQLMRRTRGELVLRWMVDGLHPGRGHRQRGRHAAQPARASRTAPRTPTPRRRTDGPPRVGRGRRRRAGLVRGRLVPRGAGDPDVRRVLGPHPARRAGGDHRPAQGQRRPAGQATGVRRPAVRRRSRRPADLRWTRTSGWPTRGPRRPTRTGSCAAGSPTPAGSTAPAGSTRGWPSSATSAA